MWFALIAVAPAPALAESVDNAEPTALAWDWSRTHRYYLETQVQLPLFMWLATPFNKQARMTAFDLRLVTTCTPDPRAEAPRKRRAVAEVLCTVDTAALSAAGMEQEVGLIAPIVAELDGILSTATIQLQVRPDGRLANIDLEDVDRRNLRVGQVNENLRLMLSRAFAGLDLQLPAGEETAWPQYGPWLMRAPASGGSSGSNQIIHGVAARNGVVELASAGRGTIEFGEGQNLYDARIAGAATFDPHTGRLLDRTWTMLAAPTASSWISFGAAGYPYVQRGRVVALSEGQDWDVGTSEELPPGTTFGVEGRTAQSAIQQGQHLGTPIPR